MRFPRDFQPAPLEELITLARSEIHRYVALNSDRVARQRGYGAMHPNTYAIGLHRRRSALFTLLQLKHQQESTS